MATMVQPVEALSVDLILDILYDDTLNMGEKLQLIEGLFVHDGPPPLPEHSGGGILGVAAKPRA